MSHSIYVASAEGHSGKSTIALGILETFSRTAPRVGVFRPVGRSVTEGDYVLDMLLAHDSVSVTREQATGVSYDDVHADPEAAMAVIVERYKAIERDSDAVLILGSDYTDVGSPSELSNNARIAANLGAPMLLVLGGRVGQGRSENLGMADARTPDDLKQMTELALVELKNAHATLFGVIANRSDPDKLDEIVVEISSAVKEFFDGDLIKAVAADGGSIPVWALPEDRMLVAPTMHNIQEALGGRLVYGDPELLSREALGVVIAGMSMANVLTRLTEGAVVVIPGDRAEVLVAVLMAHASETFPAVSGIVLNGGFELPESVERLMSGLRSSIPIIETERGTYDTAVTITSARGKLAAGSSRKYDIARSTFQAHVDSERLVSLLNLAESTVVTPLMFEYGLVDQARAANRHIVLPEGKDDRILRAASTVLARGIARLTILGDEEIIRARGRELGLNLDAATITSPFDPVLREQFAEKYAEFRAHKGISIEAARDTITDVSYFGTMMVQLGLADGMVSGAAHTTAHTIRPAFEVIKTKPGVSVVSSVFLMALADQVLVYGDCAVIPDPTAAQLGDIAISSSATARQFGIEPRVAMLSYSTGSSGSGADVEKVREATAIVRERDPELLVEGPIQYDAAADAAVAATKMPESQVAGRATVFIFPDLNTGNNTYKAVQRSAGAVAIGPVLQGLNKPINDLSRGALVADIVNTIAITAIQAGTSTEGN